MRSARMIVPLALLAALLAPGAATATPAPPSIEGPDIPTLTAPDEVVVAIAGERFDCAEGARTHTIAVPSATWDRIILEVTITPDGDPWDRLFGVAIGGVEVLRGTTPRTAFTLRKDVTEFASLLPPGGTTDVTLYMGSYVGALVGDVTLEFYADEPTGLLVLRPAASAAGVVAFGSLNGNGTQLSRVVSFGGPAPSGATVELTLSGHGDEEFWFAGPRLPRIFHVYVDDVEIATAVAMPYVYAFLGFGNENANIPCVGPGTSAFGDTVHPVMWWTAHRAADAAGIHTGNGEIPPYRAEVEASALPLLTGSRTVRVVQQNGRSRWVTSLSILLR